MIKGFFDSNKISLNMKLQYSQRRISLIQKNVLVCFLQNLLIEGIFSRFNQSFKFSLNQKFNIFRKRFFWFNNFPFQIILFP